MEVARAELERAQIAYMAMADGAIEEAREKLRRRGGRADDLLAAERAKTKMLVKQRYVLSGGTGRGD